MEAPLAERTQPRQHPRLPGSAWAAPPRSSSGREAARTRVREGTAEAGEAPRARVRACWAGASRRDATSGRRHGNQGFGRWAGLDPEGAGRAAARERGAQGRPQPLTATPEPRRAGPPSSPVAHGARSRRRRRRPRAPRRRRAAPAAPAPLHPCLEGGRAPAAGGGRFKTRRPGARDAALPSAPRPGRRVHAPPAQPDRAPALGPFSTEHGAALLVLSLRPRYLTKPNDKTPNRSEHQYMEVSVRPLKNG